jgi:hypothetical protein
MANVAVAPLPLGCTVTVLLLHEPPGIIKSFPLLRIVAPLYVFTAESVSVPEPIFVKPPLVFAAVLALPEVVTVAPPPVKVKVGVPV